MSCLFISNSQQSIFKRKYLWGRGWGRREGGGREVYSGVGWPSQGGRAESWATSWNGQGLLNWKRPLEVTALQINWLESSLDFVPSSITPKENPVNRITGCHIVWQTAVSSNENCEHVNVDGTPKPAGSMALVWDCLWLCIKDCIDFKDFERITELFQLKLISFEIIKFWKPSRDNISNKQAHL